MKKYFKLSDFATIFSTRTKADEIADNLNIYIKAFSKEDTLVVSFNKVEAMSYSFLDQFLSRLSTLHYKVYLAGWEENLSPVIKKSLKNRNYNYSKENSISERQLVTS